MENKILRMMIRLIFINFIHRNLRMIFAVLFTIVTITTRADFYTANAVPDLDKTENAYGYRYGNMNFSVQYNLDNVPASGLDQSMMSLRFITYEEDGGGGAYNAWLESGTIKYSLDNGASWHKIAYFGEHGNTYSLYLSNIIYHPEWVWTNEDPPSGHACKTKCMYLQMPSSWYGKTVNIIFEGKWERDQDGKAALSFNHSGSGISINIPTANTDNLNFTAAQNGCNGDIGLSFVTPRYYTEYYSSYSTSKAINLNNKKFKIKYRIKGTSTWYYHSDSDLGTKDVHGWYDYTNTNQTINTKLHVSDGNRGKEYEFILYLKYMFLGDDYNYFLAASNIISGKAMAFAAKPVIDDVDYSCDKTVISFSVSSLQDISSFKIMNGPTLLESVGSTSSSCEIPVANLPAYQNATISVIAVNGCNDETASDGVTVAPWGSPQNTPVITQISQLTLNAPNAGLAWTINENEATKDYSTFQIWRKSTSNNTYTLVEEDIPLTGGTQSGGNLEFTHTDPGAVMCEQNTYMIKLINDCGEKTSSESSVEMFSIFDNVIDTTSVSASTGYFNNRIELQWEYFPGYKETVTGISISRKGVGEPTFTDVKYISDNQTTQWNDITVNANQLYEYKLEAVGQCNGEQFSNPATTIGFRQKSGMVTGNVSYGEGKPVQGVEVMVSQGSVASSSITFERDSSAHLVFNDKDAFIPDSAFSLEMWVYSENWHNMQNEQTLFASRHMVLSLHQNQILLRKLKTAIPSPPESRYITYLANYSEDLISHTGWHHIAVSYGDSVRIYVNGRWVSSSALLDHGFNRDTSQLYHSFIGACMDYSQTDPYPLSSVYNCFDGNIDEFRFWKDARGGQEIARNYNRFIDGNDPSLAVYIRADEGFGNKVYDRSNINGEYNKTDALIVDANWSGATPSYEQLHASGITDEFGNYVVTGITFSGSGEVFTITPKLSVHLFSPNQTPLFIGDNDLVHNNIDFIDNSSFNVPVKVMYSNAAYYPVAGVLIKIDGNYVMGKDKQPVKTDVNGSATIDVPIGNHHISVEKYGHVFGNVLEEKEGYLMAGSHWPPKNGDVIVEHYFEEDFYTPILFQDTTTVKLVGKVAGGAVEQGKPIGSKTDPGKNNIGTAELHIELINPAYELNPGKQDTIIKTNSQTGIYAINLIPETFKITSVLTSDNYDFIGQAGGATLIDLSNKFVEHKTIDSLSDNSTEVALVYHHEQDFILRNPPSFSITNEDGETAFGDSVFIYIDGADTVEIPLYTKLIDGYEYTFGHPVFISAEEYKIILSAYEQYENHDDPQNVLIDRVPVTDGVFIVKNDIHGTDQEEIKPDSVSGKAEHEFIGGFPKVVSPFTLALNVQLKVGDNYYTHNVPDEPIQGYVLGSQPSGNNFVTNGPDIVRYILRDPPGSGSSASLSEGSTVTTFYSEKSDLATSFKTDFITSTGTNQWYASGMPPMMKILQATFTAETQNTLTTTGTAHQKYEHKHVSTLNSSISTSSSPSYTGAPGDLFWGLSTNIIFGESRDIIINPEPRMSDTEILIDSLNIDSTVYYLKKKSKLAIGTSFETEFIYSQKHIGNELIPGLRELRNSLLSDNPKYVSLLPIDHPDYGASNDDPVFAPDTIWRDTIINGVNACYGKSYVYFYDSIEYTTTNGVAFSFKDLHNDSVYFLNEQVENWIHYLAQNEEQKVKAVLDEEHKNISFDAGSSYSNSITTKGSDTFSGGISLYIGYNFLTKLGGTVDGAGTKAKVRNTTSFSHTSTGGKTTESTTTVSYTLKDNDMYNYYTVDVKNCLSGNGPVFTTRGGQSSCMYEGLDTTKYYEPGEHILSYATVRVEKPRFTVNTNNISGVPEDKPAYFELILTNESEADVPTTYTIITDNATNPHGAELFIDGVPLAKGIDVKIPAGTEIIKTLEFHKGNPDVFVYEDIKVLMKSRCDYTVKESELLTASFVPACTDVSINNLTDEWIMNLSNKDTLLINIGDYDPNNSNFNNISFQYRRPGELIPTSMMNFYNSQTAYDNAPDPKALIVGTTINWPAVFKTGTYIDGIYDIRVTATCNDGSEDYYTVAPYLRGTIDRLAPHLFGLPQPADGILSPEDEIKIRFNEEIDQGFLYARNDLISCKGVLNGTDLSTFDYLLHDGYLNFDGQSQHMVIKQGINLKYTSFSFEAWIKRLGTGRECMISQGDPFSGGLWIGFDENDKFTFIINNNVFTTDKAFTDIVDTWCHMGCVMALKENGQNEITLSVRYDGGEEIKSGLLSTGYNGSEPVYVGNSPGLDEGFYGNMHALRIWNIPQTTADLSAHQYVLMNGYEKGLLGYWPMDDLKGNKARDLAFNRDAETQATWQASRKGKALNLADNYFKFGAGGMILSDQTDFTVEFWLKSSEPSAESYLLCNGKADGTDGYNSAWAIVALPGRIIAVRNNGMEFATGELEIFDNNWHHLALTVNRHGYLNVYIDGEQRLSANAFNTTTWGAEVCYVGASYQFLNNQLSIGDYYTGGIDEIRIWNACLSPYHIQSYMNQNLNGDEPGLIAYFPFEDIRITNPLISNASLENLAQGDFLMAGDGELLNDTAISVISPMFKLKMPKSQIPFTYSINYDEVIITPTIEASKIENTVCEISIRRAKDMFGNEMASTAKWTAFVDKNPLVWDKQSLKLEKSTETPLEFEVLVHNKGGAPERFNLENLPLWLSADPEYGSLDPLESKTIVFTVNPGINTGYYNHDIYLNGAMNYNERLSLNLQVKSPEPDWVVAEENFNYSMVVFGQAIINGIISTDEYDMIAAFINGECRGKAYTENFENQDAYFANLMVYGNTANESVEFRIWDASEGRIYVDTDPVLTFIPDQISGSIENPVHISTSGHIVKKLPLAQGWKWLSFNLVSNELSDINALLKDVPAVTGSQIKSQDNSVQYLLGSGWITGNGNLSSFNNSEMYMFYLPQDTVLGYKGIPVATDTTKITLRNGWNWIAYTPQVKIPINEALSYLTPDNSDVIKSQYAFAMFHDVTGWYGNLYYLEPGLGYKYKAHNLSEYVTFIYPAGPRLKSGAYAQNSDHASDIARKYRDNMSLVAIIEPGEHILSDYDIQVFAGNELRGHASPVYIEGKNTPYYFITVYGGQGQDRLSFFTREGRLIAREEIIYSADGVLGDMDNPVILSLDLSSTDTPDLFSGETMISCQPNPFSEYVTIEYSGNDVVDYIHIYDAFGKMVKTIDADGNTNIWKGNDYSGNKVRPGIYIVKLVCGNGIIYHTKILKNE